MTLNKCKCGGDPVAKEHETYVKHYVQCGSCGAKTELFSQQFYARNAWNGVNPVTDEGNLQKMQTAAQIDTSAEAVRRIAELIDSGETGYVMDALNILEALAAERDDLQSKNERLFTFVADFADNTFEEHRQFAGTDPSDELESTTEFGPVDGFQSDAIALLADLKGDA